MSFERACRFAQEADKYIGDEKANHFPCVGGLRTVVFSTGIATSPVVPSIGVRYYLRS